MRHPNVSFIIACRSNLFREQVARFRRCEYRKPTIGELRTMWRGTGFPTLER